jgi:hypothetical protein
MHSDGYWMFYYLLSLVHSSTKHTGFLSGIPVLCLAKANWHVPVLVHVQDLSLHRHEEENEKVHQQDGPEHWDIKYRKESHHY